VAVNDLLPDHLLSCLCSLLLVDPGGLASYKEI
jgi:hypothetical protein